MSTLRSKKAYRERQLAQGLCIECNNPLAPTSKLRCEYHRVKQSAYDRAWKKRNPAARAARVRRYTERNPVKNRARGIFYRACRAGTIIRPGACQDCGKRCKPEGHHPDYLKPLEVLWVCRSCHHLRHTLKESLR